MVVIVIVVGVGSDALGRPEGEGLVVYDDVWAAVISDLLLCH